MSDTWDIITLAGKFKSHAELQDYCNQQYISLDKAQIRIKQLEEEIKHLQELLGQVTSLEPVEKVIVSTEEAICDAQIDLLSERAFQHELTLEEVKRLDLLIKNKRLIKEQNTTIVGQSKPMRPKEITNTQLIQIAGKIDKENEDG